MSALASDAKTFLRRVLPPELFKLGKTRWWWLRHDTVPSIMSWFIHKTPKIYTFKSEGSSLLQKKVQKIDVGAPTRMCRVMASQGSDKALLRHNYTPVYSDLLKDRQSQPLRIFELGLGSANPDMPFNMAFLGHPGASLRAWREIFPNATIYGADIDRDILFQEDRIKTFYCDQLDSHSIQALWDQPELQRKMDVIIDDAYHAFDANVSFLENSLEHLAPGGLYVVEDIDEKWLRSWIEKIQTEYSKRYPEYEFILMDLPNAFQPEMNNLLLVRRNSS